MSTRRPPADWPRCRLARDANCDGSQISPYGRCLAHLTGGELDQFLGQLGPGSDLDARGTNLTERLVDRLIGTFGSGRPAPLFGTALFSETRFQGAVRFANVRFTGDAWFDGAQFAGNAMFAGSEFAGNAMFTKAEFSADALFTDRASFRKDAVFDQVRFAARADFGTANIAGNASFKSTRFSAETVFSGAGFDAGAHFTGARFDKAGNLGPLVVRDDLKLDGAVFEQPVLIEAAAMAVSARHTVFADATLRLRYAGVELDHATSAGPLTLMAARQEFTVPDADPYRRGPIDESALAGTGRDPGPSLLSLRGVDASLLALVNVNLTWCRFADAHNLDQLHFEGYRSWYADSPGYLRLGGIPVWHYSKRLIIADEWDWRTQRRRFAWKPRPGQQCPALDPERLLTLYRQLRKALEDAKNEPGAADFYYGEMEMRRRASTTPTGERFLLFLYWALSGYGLRSSRALSALVIVLVLATAGFATVGFAASAAITYLPIGHPHPGAAVTYQQTTTAGPHPGWLAAIVYSIDSSTSLLSTSQPEPLTEIGNVIQILLKLLGPLLVALALLAVRNRVKR